MIYVIKHKKYDSPMPEGYQELKVGSMFDGKGDNINYLNLYINEMTGLYWIWKNTSEDVVGMAHYRRYFTKGNDFITLPEAADELKTCDIIITEPITFEKTLYGCQLEIDFKNDPEMYLKYIKKFDAYYNGFLQYLKGTHVLNPRNMFITTRSVLNDFCKFAFKSLPIAENFMYWDAKKYTDFSYVRMIGYIMERLLPFWVRKQGLNFKEMPYKEF